MPTIDTLDIQIKSTSTRAADGIRDLADSLGELKKNGSVTVAVNNLNKLSEALRKFTTIQSPGHKISALASSLQALKNVGSVATVANSIGKLATAMDSVKGLNLNGLDTQLDGIVSATSKLSGVRAGGLPTMVNALSKIGDVTQKLDGDTIRKFADRVEVLTKRLEPLSTKMTTIQAGLKGVNSNARRAGDGVKHLGTKVNATTLNMASMITVVQGIVSALRPVISMLSGAIGQALEWDGIAARFGRGFGSQADEVYSWIQRLNEEMGINTQQFMQYSSVFSTMLQGFGVGVEDSAKMALGYTELTYDIWAGYNDVYSSFADAAEAVKSAIAGEVEPVRRAGFTIVESTLEQTAANHGLEISLEKATEAQKSYLRYLTLVDQAHAQNLVGTYAREMNTAEGVMRTFAQSVKSMAQALGSLFLPVLIKVMPWVQAFIELITDAIRAIAAFFGVEIQPIDWSGYGGGGSIGGLEEIGDSADSAADSLDKTADAAGSAKKAIEDLKRATIGIDELNMISPPSPNSGGSGSGGAGGGGIGGGLGAFEDLGVDSLWDESIFDQIESKVDEIKDKIKAWLPVIELVGAALAGLGIATLLKNLGDALAQMNLLQKALATVAIVAIEAALVFTFADKYLESGNLLYLIGEALVTAAAGYLLFRAWGPGGALLGLSVSILAQLVALEMNLADGTVSLSSPETWIQGITTTLMGALGGAIISKHTGFFAKEGFVIGLGVTASLTLLAIRMGAIESGEISSDSIEAWILEVGSIATAALAGKWLGAALYTGGGPMGALIGVTAGLILNLVGTISVKGEDFGNEISDWINAGLTTAMTGFTAAKLWKIVSPYVTEALTGIVPKIGTALSGALTGGWTAITGAISSIPVWGWIVAAIVAVLGLAIVDYDFTEIGHKIGEAIGKACRVIVDFASDIGGAIWDGVCAAFDWCKENITWDNVKNFVGALFKKETWTEIVWPKIKEIGKSIWDGLWEGIWDGVKNLWGNITEFVDGFIQGFKDGFEIHSPAATMKPIGEFIVAGIWEGITGSLGGILKNIGEWCGDLWEGFKSFFSGGNKKTESVNVDVKLVKSGWTTVKNWIGKIPGVDQAVKLIKSGWSTVKGWVGSIPTLSQAIKLVKNGWSSVKRWVGSIPTLSQAIKLVKSGWSSVKKWIGSIPKLSQSIGLIKSGWKSVKGWIGSMPTLKAKIGLVKSGWTTIKKWLGDLTYKLSFKLPKIGINWGKKTFAGFTISYPTGFYTYAKGGFPDFGELFIAREAGPEMVGKIGNKTTVANNDQIVEAVSEGVYSAVMAAIKARESNGSQSVNVYLDGRMVTQSVERTQRERGASIMGNQVYAY